MLNWIELEQHFRALEPALAYARIDAQWGSSGEHWRLAGAADTSAKSRFEALSRLAGDQLKTARIGGSRVVCADLVVPGLVDRTEAGLRDALERSVDQRVG